MTVLDGPGAATADHPFEPRLEEVGVAYGGWSYVALPPNPILCRHCRLAEAAHTSALQPHETTGAYRCPYCVDREIQVCDHQGAPRHMDGRMIL